MASKPLTTAKPDETISLDDFIAKAIDEQCVIVRGKEIFVGDPGTSTGLAYPHLHVWRDGTIALSVAKSRNTKVGENGVINIQKLYDACTRFGVSTGYLFNTVRWVVASAS